MSEFLKRERALYEMNEKLNKIAAPTKPGSPQKRKIETTAASRLTAASRGAPGHHAQYNNTYTKHKGVSTFLKKQAAAGSSTGTGTGSGPDEVSSGLHSPRGAAAAANAKSPTKQKIAANTDLNNTFTYDKNRNIRQIIHNSTGKNLVLRYKNPNFNLIPSDDESPITPTPSSMECTEKTNKKEEKAATYVKNMLTNKPAARSTTKDLNDHKFTTGNKNLNSETLMK